MTRISSGAVLFLGLAVLCSQGWALDSGSVKAATDRAGNYLIDHYNLGTGTFGKSRQNKLPGFNALIVQSLCESHREYRVYSGPFISEPVKQILKMQREDGAFVLEGTGLDAYNTALCILALKAASRGAHEKAIEKAEKYLRKCQAKDGGFGYDDKKNQTGDLSQTWISLEALTAAGLKADSDAFKNAVKFIRRCQDNPETNPDLEGSTSGSGGAFYKPGGSAAGNETNREGRTIPKPYGTMTAAMIEALLICDMKADCPEIQAALRWFKANYNVKENPGVGPKGYFYYAFAFAKAMTALEMQEIELADGTKVNWAADLGAHLMAIQARDGSFVNTDPQFMEDDPALCTAYALKAMTLCYEALKKGERK